MARFSIRGLLIAVTFVAVACASLKNAGPAWWVILSGAALLLLMASIIVAFVGRGEQRAKAVGFLACASVYASIVLVTSHHTINIELPSTVATKLAHERLAARQYFDLMSGDVLPDFQPPPGTSTFHANPRKYVPGSVPDAGFVGTYIAPDYVEFLRIAHLLWAMLFGFLGSTFAGFVYRRSRD